MKWFLSHMLLPVLFGTAGLFIAPQFCLASACVGLLVNFLLIYNYPLHKKKLYLTARSGWFAVDSDFLWFCGVQERSALDRGDTTKRGCLEWVNRKVEESKLGKVGKAKNYVYVPEAAKQTSIKDDAEHVKEIATQYNIKGGEALAKIEEIRKKTYDEPPAKPMIEPPTVLKVTPHAVTFKKNGQTFTRSRRGFVKQYGEPAVKKKETKKAKTRAKA